MQSKSRFLVILFILALILVSPAALLALGEADWAPPPELTNSNIDSSAFFWVKTADGKTKIVELLPETRMKLPLDTIDFQFLYLQKKYTKEKPANKEWIDSAKEISASSEAEPERDSAFEQEKEKAEEEALAAFASIDLNPPAVDDEPVLKDPVQPSMLPAVRIIPASERYRPRGRFYRLRQFFRENW